MPAKSKACMRMLAAAASMQWCVADMLEAKADEMETLRDWLLDTVRDANMDDCNSFVTQSCDYHSQLIEMIQGITKMEYGLAKHVELMLVEEQIVPDASFADGGGVFGGGEG